MPTHLQSTKKYISRTKKGTLATLVAATALAFVAGVTACFLTSCSADRASEAEPSAERGLAKGADPLLEQPAPASSDVLPGGTSTMPEDASGLYPQQDTDTDLIGYVDKEGAWVIDPQFTSADWFSDGLAAVIDPDTKLLGYIDTSGRWAIEARYPYQSGERSASFIDSTQSPPVEFAEKAKLYSFSKDSVFSWRFSEGLAAVTDSLDYGSSGGRYGYIDLEGNTVVEKKYLMALPFNDGIAAVQDEESGLMGYIDPQGNWVIEPSYAYAGSFSEGYAAVQDSESGQYGFIDKAGAWVIKPRVSFATGFSEGLAAALDSETGKLGYLDVQGAWAIEPKFESSSIDLYMSQDFSEGMAKACPSGSMLCGYVDKTGAWVIKPQFASIGTTRFSSGVAVAELPSGEVGCINKAGEWVVEPARRDLSAFSYGLAAIREDADGRYGYIDTEGRRVV